MATVHLEIVPWLTKSLGMDGAGHAKVDETMPDGASVLDLLHCLAQRYPEFSRIAFMDDGRLSRQVYVVVNDRALDLAGGVEAKLKEGDRLLLLPAVSGG
jgi:MoaD family protein